VVPTIDAASRSEIQFDYLEQPDGSFAEPKIFRLDPSAAFVSDGPLDFTIVAVERRNARGDLLTDRGFIPMDPRPGKAVIGEALNIIHHGGGEPLEVSLRDNLMLRVMESFIQYQGRTGRGSGGAPVLNDQWELVGIHHAAQLVSPGSVKVRGADVSFVGEAIRVSSVVSRLLSLGATDVLREVLSPEQLSSVPSPGEVGPQLEESRVSGNPLATPPVRSTADVLVLDPREPRARDAVFLSYARADQKENSWKDRLEVQLRAIARFRDFRVWDDGRIAAGADWQDEIRNALNSCRVAVLLIGPNFLTSEFIQTEELPVLLRDADAEGVRVFPLITDFCPYRYSPLNRFQSVNDPKEPLESLPRSEQNKILVELAEKVAAIFE
jgi:hypothetical protein